jgi:hypothetical protein
VRERDGREPTAEKASGNGHEEWTQRAERGKAHHRATHREKAITG